MGTHKLADTVDKHDQCSREIGRTLSMYLDLATELEQYGMKDEVCLNATAGAQVVLLFLIAPSGNENVVV